MLEEVRDGTVNIDDVNWTRITHAVRKIGGLEEQNICLPCTRACAHQFLSLLRAHCEERLTTTYYNILLQLIFSAFLLSSSIQHTHTYNCSCTRFFLACIPFIHQNDMVYALQSRSYTLSDIIYTVPFVVHNLGSFSLIEMQLVAKSFQHLTLT